MLQNNPSNLRRLCLIACFTFFFLISSEFLIAAQRLEQYFAHKTVEDKYGVIAPWYKGQNGQCDFRVRVSAEALKRFPWIDQNNAIVAAPYAVYTPNWGLDGNGQINIPSNPRMRNEKWNIDYWRNGDVGQRTMWLLRGMTNYYRYSGDPVAITYLHSTAKFLLEGGLTGENHPWPRFPITVPVRNNLYTKSDPNGFIQLDLAGGIGTGVLNVYKITGEKKYWDIVCHWADLFAEKGKIEPGKCPWERYANPQQVPWSKDLFGNDMKGGIVLVLEFLDEMIKAGYTGKNGAVVKIRDAGREYFRDVLLPEWLERATWGCYFWDGNTSFHTLVAVWDCQYLMNNRDYFPNWENDTRNIMSLFLNRASTNPDSMEDTYSGAWCVPESGHCCWTSLSYGTQMFAPVFAQYADLANDPWSREIARRMVIASTYDIEEDGRVVDGIEGKVRVTGGWFNIAHPIPLRHLLEAIEWQPEWFAPSRENHIVRNSSTITSVVYGKGDIRYRTFDSPKNTVEILRLSFVPKEIIADDESLKLRKELSQNGYTIKKLAGGDCIVTVRHDGKSNVIIRGKDPQREIDDKNLSYAGDWTIVDDNKSKGNQYRTSSKAGAKMQIKFSGNQVRIIGNVDENGGQADIFLDGQKQLVFMDCWNPQPRSQQILYEKSGLSNTTHLLEVVVQGKRNPASNGHNIYIDSVQYSAATGSNGYGIGGGPIDTQRMIFGYPSRIDYEDSRNNLWKPATEFCTRLKGKDSVSTWWTEPCPKEIINTPDSELYRYGVHAQEFWVNVTVGPGKYYAKLKFTATERQKCNGPMTILVNGKEVISNLDVEKAAGGLYKALDKVVDNIKPQNGIIEIRLKYTGKETNGEAFIQAIEVGPTGDLWTL